MVVEVGFRVPRGYVEAHTSGRSEMGCLFRIGFEVVVSWLPTAQHEGSTYRGATA